MRLQALIEAWLPKAKAVWPNELAYREIRRLVASLLGQSEIWVEAHSDLSLSQKQLTLLQKALRSFAKGQPVAQLIQSAPFFGRTFYVNQHTLIPRPETVLLLETALAGCDRHTLAIDIGTGSGCIAVSIAAERTATRVFASDISRTALSVAKKNAKALLKENDIAVTFFQGSLFHRALQAKVTKESARKLLFTANLPYLPQSDRQTMPISVTKFEPAQALFAPQDGCALIERLLKQIRLFSQRDGRSLTALFEFDPPQATRLRSFAENLFPEATIEIQKDENGRSRLLSVYCPNPAKV